MNFLEHIWDIMRELSPWLLLGAAIAGVLHVLIPADFIKKHLGKSGWWSSVKAAIIGVPMPLCSCSVIPTGIGLKKDGASDSAAVSFLISTPQTGVDSISVAAGFLGWPFALFKVLSAFIMGVLGGLLVAWFAPKHAENTDHDAAAASSCCSPPSPPPTPASCCGGETTPAPKKTNAFKRAYTFAIEDLLRMIWFWLVIGILLSALLSTFVDPGSLSDYRWATGISAMLIMLLISLPLYVCATASVPIAASLIVAGLPTGAALVFLMAGPATNIATIGAIIKAFGKRITFLYLACVIIGSMFCGWAFDSIFTVTDQQVHHHHEHVYWWTDASAIVLSLLILYFAVGDILKRLRKPASASSCCH